MQGYQAPAAGGYGAQAGAAQGSYGAAAGNAWAGSTAAQGYGAHQQPQAAATSYPAQASGNP